ncbi:MAG: HlyD family efflux transporter periplasmic adaptor subunit [Calditrichaeota bacterium]|nr:MAG: HlyD family efflux transporter periplasmic adaptor subunit [Calditrichota bacterium]
MKNRKTSLMITAGILIIGFLISSVLSNQKESLQRNTIPENKKEIRTIKIENEDMNAHISTSGRLTAYNKIEIYAEVSGVLEKNSIRFKEGNTFKKGERLVQIDDQVYRNNLLAQKSSLLNLLTLLLPDLKIDFPGELEKWENYLADFDLNKNLRPLPEASSDQEKYYIASRNIFNLYYTAKSMEATLEKYTIRAPYAGVVTESNLNPGTLVRAGQKLGEYTNTSIYELQVAVGVIDVNYLQTGMHVNLISEDIPGNYSGKIVRINKTIDQATQTINVFIHTSNDRLKEGLYMTANFDVLGEKNVVEIPRSGLTKDREVYVVVDSNAIAIKKVDIIKNTNDNVVVKGLKDGDFILGSIEDKNAFTLLNLN